MNNDKSKINTTKIYEALGKIQQSIDTMYKELLNAIVNKLEEKDDEQFIHSNVPAFQSYEEDNGFTGLVSAVFGRDDELILDTAIDVFEGFITYITIIDSRATELDIPLFSTLDIFNHNDITSFSMLVNICIDRLLKESNFPVSLTDWDTKSVISKLSDGSTEIAISFNR